MIDDLFVAADHQAIAPVEPPDAAAGTGVDVINALFPQGARAAHVVLVEAVAAVDHDIAGLQHAAQLRDRTLGCFTGRQHQPDGAGRGQFCRQILEAAAAGGAFFGQRRDRIGIAVIDHAGMAVALQPLHDVAAHAAETDDAELHTLTSSQRGLRCFTQRRDAGVKIV